MSAGWHRCPCSPDCTVQTKSALAAGHDMRVAGRLSGPGETAAQAQTRLVAEHGSVRAAQIALEDS